MASPRRLPLLAVVTALVVVAAVVAVVATRGGDGGEAADGPVGEPSTVPAPVTADVTVEGEPLPPLPQAGDDPAVGLPMPVASGTGLDGEPMTVGQGGPTVVVYVAHWCPHCQAEVPRLQQWLNGGGLPGGASISAVSTAVDERADNYPPARWLADEGWTVPTLADSADSAAATAAGVTGYPFFVAVDGQGRVVERASGEQSIEAVEAMVGRLTG